MDELSGASAPHEKWTSVEGRWANVAHEAKKGDDLLRTEKTAQNLLAWIDRVTTSEKADPAEVAALADVVRATMVFIDQL